MKVLWKSSTGVEYYLFASALVRGTVVPATSSSAASSTSTIERAPSPPAQPTPNARKTARLYTEALLQTLERDRDVVRTWVRGRRVVFINRDAPSKIEGARPDGFWKTITGKLCLVGVHQADVEADFDFWNEALRVFTTATMPDPKKQQQQQQAAEHVAAEQPKRESPVAKPLAEPQSPAARPVVICSSTSTTPKLSVPCQQSQPQQQQQPRTPPQCSLTQIPSSPPAPQSEKLVLPGLASLLAEAPCSYTQMYMPVAVPMHVAMQASRGQVPVLQMAQVAQMAQMAQMAQAFPVQMGATRVMMPAMMQAGLQVPVPLSAAASLPMRAAGASAAPAAFEPVMRFQQGAAAAAWSGTY
eukprot:m51a1_g1636 hypothetical protein (357) ;mRNA; r:301648-303059